MEVLGVGVAMEPQPVRALLIEDSEEDADLLMLELRRGGFLPEVQRVDTPEALSAALEQPWDVILCDYSMPRFTMEHALAMVQERELDVPFLIVSATIGEEVAVEAMRAGACDYILKDRLGRLVPAVRRELRQLKSRRERQRLEEQFRQSQKLESLGLLAGGIAHDFNNLLTGILGNASLVLDLLSPPEAERAMLEDVIRAAERAAELTRQLLAYAGKGRFVVQPVHLSEVVREIGQLVRSSIPRHVELKTDLADDLPLVDADPSQMQQLVMNLVINAAEAMGEKQGTIEVVTGVHPPTQTHDARVFLRVRDEGCGMDAATRAQIFDPFFTTKFTGRGLGLAAVQGIVRSHNGTVTVSSQLNHGSTFEVCLPPAETQKALWRETPEAPALAQLCGKGLVLIVDDEEFVRRTARSALRRYGYEVIEAENGAEGLEVFHRLRDRISVVLLDLTMPVMSGEETHRRIKAARPDVPVIVSSGYEEMEAVRRFGGTNMTSFIKKPYEAQRLAQKVKSAIDGSTS